MAKTLYPMPKAGLFDASGQLTPAGHKYFTGIQGLSEPRAGSAEEFLIPDATLVYTEALWGTMQPVPTSGALVWTPDLGSRLDFVRTLSGASTMAMPVNVPADALPFFSVMFQQDAVGGWGLSMGDGFEGEAPDIFTGAGDKTLCGFKVTGPSTFTGWAIKGISAS